MSAQFKTMDIQLSALQWRALQKLLIFKSGVPALAVKSVADRLWFGDEVFCLATFEKAWTDHRFVFAANAGKVRLLGIYAGNAAQGFPTLVESCQAGVRQMARESALAVAGVAFLCMWLTFMLHLVPVEWDLATLALGFVTTLSSYSFVGWYRRRVLLKKLGVESSHQE